jgi:hypothetical protein
VAVICCDGVNGGELETVVVGGGWWVVMADG